MSGESTDSESTPRESYKRSHSLLRQVRASLTGRDMNKMNRESPSISLLRQKRRSFDIIAFDQSSAKCQRKISSKPRTPIAFSHRLSLFDQMKSHLTGTRKYRRTVPSVWLDDDDNDKDEFQSIPSITSYSEAKSSPVNEVNSNSDENDFDLSSPGSVEKAMLLNDSLNTGDVDENQSQINSNKMTLNRFKDHITQRARNVITKAPSLNSLLSNSPSTPDQVYWTEIFIERGKDLAVKDFNGTSDPYVKVFYGTEEQHTTDVITKNLNPIWNERISIFTDDLNIPLYFYVYDHDRIGRDEAMGTAKLDLSRIPIDRNYTATLELENEKRSDEKKGTLKIGVNITPKTIEFRDEVRRNWAKQVQRNTNRVGSTFGVFIPRRTIDVFIIEGRNLVPSGSNKLCSPYVRLKYGTNKKYRTQTIKSTTNPVWHQAFMYDTNSTELLPLELTVYDDTSSSGEFLGRGICNLAHLEEERTHRITVELEDGPGVIEIFVTITVTTALQEATNDGESSSQIPMDVMPSKLTNEDFERYKFSSILRTLNPIRDVGKVEIKIYQARDLSAKDITGKSDPFCIIELDSNRLRTHTLYKTLNPVWNKSFVIPVQDIHSVLEITVYDEDTNKTYEFIGKIAIPLLAIKNGEKKWLTLKDRKCLLPVKGAIEIEATLIFTNLKAVLRTFNPRQTAYYQIDGKISVGAIKQHVLRIQNMLKGVMNVGKFINYCFQWENPILSFFAFLASVIIVWNFELYMLPCTFLLLFARNAVIEYRRGRLGKPFATLGDETISAVVQPVPIDEEILEVDVNTKEQKKSFIGMIQGIQDTVLEIQGYIDTVASTLERIKNLFNFTVPWLSTLLIIILFLVGFLLYYVPLRYLVLAFVINKFTKCFRKPKGYIDNNEIIDFLSRLPSDTELMQYREFKVLGRLPTPKKTKPTK